MRSGLEFWQREGLAQAPLEWREIAAPRPKVSHMRNMRKFLVIGLCVVASDPIAARDASHAPRPQAQKKDPSFVAPPIKPMEKNDEKPRAGWNGFYGGLNAGGGFGETEDR